MTKRILVLVLTLTIIAVGASAQRKTDKLDRGLVVVPHFASINYGNGTNGSQDGNLVSWRILPEEYYDVTYNVYRDGTKLNDAPLTISNFVDRNGSSSSQYQVSAVVKGVEQENCASAKPWTMLSDTYNQPYQKILLANVYDRDGQDVTEHYWANDAAFADLDGDGQLEMIVKRLNMADAEGVNTGRRDSKGHAIYNIYPRNSKEFVVIDAYNINWQTWEASLMWRIDCGPNMVSTNSTEINIMAFDWDQDVADATAIANAMKKEGWTFASHTYGHWNATTHSAESLQSDNERWMTVNHDIVGDIDKIIFAFGGDIGTVGQYTADNDKFQYFKSQGYVIYCNVDGHAGWTEFGPDYMRTGRVPLDGFAMYQYMTESGNSHSTYKTSFDLLGIHDVDQFFNKYRITPIESE